MDTESRYDDHPAYPYWVGVHVPKIGTIATAPVSEDDLQLLEMSEHVDNLSLEGDYDTLSEEEQVRLSRDENVALQLYREFMNQYEKNPDQFTEAVQKLLSVNVVTEHLDENPSIAVRYLTEEGRRLLAEEKTDIPDQNEWEDYVDEEKFTTKTDVLYAQTLDDVEHAAPVRDLNNLKLWKWNKHLKSWGDGMEDQAEAQKRMDRHLTGWRDGMEDQPEALERSVEALENLRGA